MRTFIRLKIYVVSLMLITLSSCQEDELEARGPLSKTRLIDKTEIGDGKVSLWLQTDKEDKPEKLSVVFSKKAFDNLPSQGEFVTSHVENEYVLNFDKVFVNLPYDHFALNWNPNGHSPEPIYGLPHFDFHFYMMSDQERHKITPEDPKMTIYPDAKYLPSGFFFTEGVPQMGMHWVDPTAPELNGAKFTHTFIYGSYDGSVTFVEPMITLEYLQSKPNQKFTIKQPEAFEKEGYYPTEYGVYYDVKKGEYSVTLENFVYRQASL